jgi:hypothetical protein
MDTPELRSKRGGRAILNFAESISSELGEHVPPLVSLKPLSQRPE